MSTALATLDVIEKQVKQLNRDIEAVALKIQYPNMSEFIEQLLKRHNLTAAASKGPLTFDQVGEALRHDPKLSVPDRIAVKLKLWRAGVLRR